MLYRSCILLITLMLFTLMAYGQTYVQGRILDADNNEPLPFATIIFSETTSGTISNAQGIFQLQLTAQHSDTLLVSFIGYESKKVLLQEIIAHPVIYLKPTMVELDELVVYAMSPEDILRKAIRKYSMNYANVPFTTTAYYREVFTENQEYISLNEGVFFSSYPDYQDTIPNQHQLALYRSASDKEQIDFMHDWVEDKKAKDKKKALKKGEEWNEEDENARDIIRMSFGGPEEILKLDLMKDTEYCLDTTKFKKFRYQFGKMLTYQGRDLMEILFVSRGQVDHQKMNGVIHLDVETDAIVSVAYQGKLIIPALIKPILFAFGLSVKEPYFNKSLKYQFFNGRWYPDTFQWDVSLALKKRYVFHSNEFSAFTGHQIFKVNDLNIDAAINIEEAFRFDPDKEPKDQIHPINTLDWHNVNTLPLEDLTGK
jgi:hypothetical protein